MSDRANGVFEPEIVEAMGRAFEMAAAKLDGLTEAERKSLAAKIVAAARANETSDPVKLCEKAVGNESSATSRSKVA